MKHKIVNAEAFDVIAKIKRFPKDKSRNKELIPAFWHRCMQEGTVARLADLAHKNNLFKDALIGITPDYYEAEDDFAYGIGAHYGGEACEDKALRVLHIPAATYGVFDCVGQAADVLDEVYAYVFGEFFQNQPFRPGGTVIEVYPATGADRQDYHRQIWFSLEEKEN